MVFIPTRYLINVCNVWSEGGTVWSNWVLTDIEGTDWSELALIG